jgi:hypothetical protein
MIKVTVVTKAYHYCRLHIKIYSAFLFFSLTLSLFHMQMKLLGITNVDLDLVRQRLIIFSTSVRYLRKRWECNGTMYQLFVDFKKAYDSVKMKVLYNIFIEFGITRKPVWLIKMCLNETYTTVIIGKNMSDRFPIQNDLKTETLYHH